ncbi:hypothetical protein GRZ55_08345 [Chelativorans sp. ZYF759]|uniref:type I restriction endonuclease n=1 Tax=Chelativorans sp. ZYF759 TaxID=2692213 RepID=UPI00145F5115|nr:type I restriction endonuclease [Chelativorans sp. ZYF759]NMG39249.1 hypothetical protein [Chelativorans sp. ZYF759]
MQPDLSFKSDLVRRVRNLALGPKTPSNALVPIFEAIYNSLHAIQDRFGDQWCTAGRIAIAMIDYGGSSPSVEIRDNGVGLDDENFVSFRTYDSDHKARRGGKGVGRLSWLKVFDHAAVVSDFLGVDGKMYRRQFAVALDNASPIRNYSLAPSEATATGTSIQLMSMRPEYVRHMPTKMDTILRKIVAHFLPYLVAQEVPSITIETDESSQDLVEVLASKKVELGTDDFDIAESGNLTITHNLLDRGVVEGKAAHKIYLAANGRVVAEYEIGLPLGLNTYVERDGEQYVYAGVISGEMLDQSVNTERTAFDLEDDLIDEIKRAALTGIRQILSPQIGRVIQRQTELTRNVIKKYPRFSYLVGDPRAFVEAKVPRNFNSAEQIYQQLAIYDYRENRDLERKVETMSRGSEDDDPVEAGVATLLNRLSQQEFSVLADYTVRRKIVLDLLEKRLGYKPDGTMKHHAEEALHKFVVPMKVTSTDVHIDSHNLWIVDDKLTYYEHWASDKQMKRIIKEEGSSNRPDVLLFNGRTAFHRPGTDQPVVIIEFKKPARNEYNEDENPFTQIYGYIEELRGGAAADRDGGVIQEVDNKTPFFCYIIADLTPNLRKWLRMAQINVPLPGGGGFYGYNPEYNAFIQALSYRYVLKDARLRNEAFFKRLKI